jgi:hypothetical protein
MSVAIVKWGYVSDRVQSLLSKKMFTKYLAYRDHKIATT